MAIIMTNDQNYQDIADAIRAKGVSGTFQPGEMGSAIRSISGGGSSDEYALEIVPGTSTTMYLSKNAGGSSSGGGGGTTFPSSPGAAANIVELTQAEYNALSYKDPDIAYFITDGVNGHSSVDAGDISYNGGSIASALDDKVSKTGDTITGDLIVNGYIRSKNNIYIPEGQSFTALNSGDGTRGGMYVGPVSSSMTSYANDGSYRAIRVVNQNGYPTNSAGFEYFDGTTWQTVYHTGNKPPITMEDVYSGAWYGTGGTFCYNARQYQAFIFEIIDGSGNGYYTIMPTHTIGGNYVIPTYDGYLYFALAIYDGDSGRLAVDCLGRVGGNSGFLRVTGIK